MLMFCLGMDPILRWLIAGVLHRRDRVCGYADDLGFSLFQFAYSLPRLGRAFVIIADVTGLTLKLKKCAVVPHDRRDTRKCQTSLQ